MPGAQAFRQASHEYRRQASCKEVPELVGQILIVPIIYE